MTGGTGTLEAGKVDLKPAQEAALAELESGNLAELTRADYEDLTGVSRSQAAYDLADLVTFGLLERVGAGRATRYRLGRGGAGRPRKWTEERIRDELAELCADLGRWPRRIEFQEAGRADLYLAASRYGGIAYWAAKLGLREIEPEREREAKGRTPPSTYRRLARRMPPVARASLRKGAIVLAGALLLVGLTYGGLLVLVDPAPVVGERPEASRAGDGSGAQGTPRDPATKPRAAAPAVAKEGTSGSEAVALRLSAVAGHCWLEVRRGSEEGRLLFEGTLAAGHRQTFTGRRLWIRLGAPGNLRARLDRRTLDLPKRTSSVLVTRRGLRVLDMARPASPPPPAPADEAEPSDDAVVVSSTPSSTDTSGPSTSSAPASSLSATGSGSSGSTHPQPSGSPSPDRPDTNAPTPDPPPDAP